MSRRALPSVEELELDAAEADDDSLVPLSVEDVETARVGSVVLRERRREEATRLDVRLTVEVVRARRAPAPVAAYQLELTCNQHFGNFKP